MQELSRRFLTRAHWAIVAIAGAAAATVLLAALARGPDRVTRTRIIESALVIELILLVILVKVVSRYLARQIGVVEAQQKALAERNASLMLVNRHLAEAQRVARLAYWEIDASGVVFWSPEMYRLCGLEPSEGPPPTDRYLAVVHPDDRDKMTAVARRAVESRRPFTEQYRLAVPGQPLRTVQASGRVVPDERGGTKLVGTVQDVSERVHLEAQLRQSQKLEAIGKLAGGVAHDFNNLLTVVGAYCHFVLEDPATPPATRADVDAIRRAGEKAASLTRQLLAFSRQQVFAPVPVNLNETVEGIVGMLRRLLGEHIQIQVRLETGLPPVTADRAQMDQVLLNLAVNARDAMPGGGKLTIETASVMIDDDYIVAHPAQRAGPHVTLTVSDTGQGMSEEVLEHIFEPFFTTKPAGSGTGLGLATVHGIVQQSGGHIRVYSEPGHGTVFKVYLPQADGSAVVAPAGPPSLPLAHGRGRILLVEDELPVRRATSRILRSAGFEVLEAGDGHAALAVAREEQADFDMILTDMVMPRMTGAELVRQIRRIRPALRALVMSGYAPDAMASGAVMPPDVHFMEKPFNAHSLVAKIQQILTGEARPAEG